MSESVLKSSPSGVPGAVTDTSRIRGEMLTYPGAGGDQVNGYLARPAADGSYPALIVIHEAYGLNDHIKDIVNRFANIGYVALGVDLYSREGGPPPKGDREAMMARLFSISDERVLGDLDGAADLLRAREDVTGKLGCIGFCMGGRYTLLFAGSSEKLDVAVDCWGGFIDKATPDTESTPERPTPPLALAERITCPLMAAIGAEDQSPSPELGERLRANAEKSGQEVTVEIYEDAGHAFFADYRADFYRPAAAAKLWEAVVPFLERHLK